MQCHNENYCLVQCIQVETSEKRKVWLLIFCCCCCFWNILFGIYPFAGLFAGCLAAVAWVWEANTPSQSIPSLASDMGSHNSFTWSYHLTQESPFEPWNNIFQRQLGDRRTSQRGIFICNFVLFFNCFALKVFLLKLYSLFHYIQGNTWDLLMLHIEKT